MADATAAAPLKTTLRSKNPKLSPLSLPQADVGGGSGGMTMIQANNNAPESHKTGGRRQRRRRRRRQKTKELQPLDNLTRIKRRVKYLLIKMRVEQNLIDAYSGEGWKGQSREKIRPEQELQRAESQVLHSKLAIREAIHELDKLGFEGSLKDSAFDAEGCIYHEEIFCAKCKSQEAVPDNDIILCDGACNRGFHQYCLNPPLATEDIPPGDEGWLCPVCECKMECIEVINAYMSTTFEVENSWEEFFAEAAAIAAGIGPGNGGGDWPSTDSEDDDYDPEGLEERPNSESEKEGKEEDSSSSSDSESESGQKVGFSNSSSDDASGKFKTPSIGKSNWDHTNSVQADSVDAGRSLDSSADEDSESPLVDRGRGSRAVSDDEGPMIVAGKRQHKAVDYKKLHDEMFGNTELNEDFVSEDEDWGPKRRRRRTNADTSGKPGVGRPRALASNISTSKEGPSHENQPDVQKAPTGDGAAIVSRQDAERKIWRRLPDSAVEALRQVLAKDQLPSKSRKEELSEQLGLSYCQVHSWFKNQRHQALRKGLVTPRSQVSKTANAMIEAQVSTSDGPVFNEAHTAGNEKKPRTKNTLSEKLDEVQSRLLELKRTLEDFARSMAVEDVKDVPGEGVPKFEDRSVEPSANGKRVVYVPVAEVRERPSAATSTGAY